MFECWDEVELDLRVETTLALDEGLHPEPLLAAFDDDGPVALVTLRPFEPEEVLAALVEILALLLPLGARRLALGLPARARIEDGQAVAEETAPDGRALLVVATATASDGDEPHLEGRLLPLAHDGDCWQWDDNGAVDIDAQEWDVTRALGVLLSPEAGLVAAGGQGREELQAQLARCLLLGHVVALAPQTADRLEPDRLDGPDLPLPSLER